MDDYLFAVKWNFSINGVTLMPEDKKTLITDISIEELCDGSDTLTVNITDPDFEIIDDNIFIEEASISCDLQLEGDSNIIKFDGYISAIDIDFPEQGAPTLAITCLDEATHRMNREKKKRSWDNVTRADVVQKIAKEYGLKCEIEPGYSFVKEDTITQSEVTDIEFIENLAGEEAYPFMAKVMNGTIYYKKKGLLEEPVCTLTYFKYPHTIKSFSPRINKETRQEKISTGSINTDTKKTEKSTASKSSTKTDTQGKSVKTSSSGTSSSTSSESKTKYMKYNAETRKWESTNG